jgi:AraC family transcriptional activator of tynA and feaB
MVELASFSAGQVAPRERIARWDAQVWTPVSSFRTEALSVPFEGEARHAHMGPVHLFRVSATAHRLTRTAAPDPADRRGLAMLVVQQRGTATVTQGGREIELEPGAWTVCDADRRFGILSPQGGEQLILLIPRDRLGLGTGLGSYASRRYGDAGGTARLLPCYLTGLFEELDAAADSNCAELADIATQLVRLALFEARQSVPPISMRETLRLRVKDHVRRNLRNPAMSIESVAAAFGCTKRHLHKVFIDDEMTLSQFIWAQRLESCREALRNPHLVRHSITEISFMWGFNNSAHFSKAFKGRFGLPPGTFRERSIATGAEPAFLHDAA